MSGTLDEAAHGWPPAGSVMTSHDEARRAEFEEWVHARYPSLLRFGVLLTGNRSDAEDACQSALAKLWLAWDRVRDRNAMDAYARQVVLNEQRMTWRRAWFRRERPTDEPPEPPPSTRADSATQRAVWQFLATLPPRQRAVLVLRYYEDLTEDQIAESLGISAGTVKSQASRGLAALRSALAADPALDPWSDHA